MVTDAAGEQARHGIRVFVGTVHEGLVVHWSNSGLQYLSYWHALLSGYHKHTITD